MVRLTDLRVLPPQPVRPVVRSHRTRIARVIDVLGVLPPEHPGRPDVERWVRTCRRELLDRTLI